MITFAIAYIIVNDVSLAQGWLLLAILADVCIAAIIASAFQK